MTISDEKKHSNYGSSQKITGLVFLVLISIALFNVIFSTDRAESATVASSKNYSFYVPVYYNGKIYYIYWISNTLEPRGELTPSQFAAFWNSPIYFEFVTYSNGTIVTNTTLVLTILSYLYMWLTLEHNWIMIEEYYGLNSPGYLGLKVLLENSPIPTLGEIFSGETIFSYYALQILSIIPLIKGFKSLRSLLSGTSFSASQLRKAMTIFIELIHTIIEVQHNIITGPKADEIKELLKEYGISGSNIYDVVSQIQKLPIDKQIEFISKLYSITEGQPLPNPIAKAVVVELNFLIGKGVVILASSFTASLVAAIKDTLSLEQQGVITKDQFASEVWDEFTNNFPEQIADSIDEEFGSDPNVEALVFLLAANVYESSVILPDYAVYTQLMAWMQVTNESYLELNQKLIEFEDSNIINLTLTKEIYYDIILNNLFWSMTWYELFKTQISGANTWFFYSINSPISFTIYYLTIYPKYITSAREYLLASQYDFNISVDELALIGYFLYSATKTVENPITGRVFVIPLFIPETLASDPFGYFPTSLLEEIGKFTSDISSAVSWLGSTVSKAIAVIRIPFDPPLVVVNSRSGTIIVNGTEVLSNDPFAAFTAANGTLEIVTLMPSDGYIGLESNETLNVSVTVNGANYNITLQPYNAQVYAVNNTTLLQQNTSAVVHIRGIIEVSGSNGTTFIWISGPSGNLEMQGAPPGQYNVTNGTSKQVVTVEPITNTAHVTQSTQQLPAGTSPISSFEAITFVIILTTIIIGIALILTRKK